MRLIFSQVVLILIFYLSIHSQDISYNRWSVELSYGATKAINPYTPGYWTNTLGFYHVDLGYRYMLNNKFGLLMDLGIDRINNDGFGIGVKGSKEFKSFYLRSSFQGCINIGRISNFQDFSQSFGLLIHGGIGISSLKNENSKWFTHWKRNQSDEMVHFILGATQQIRLHNNWSLKSNISFISNIYQSYTWDMRSMNYKRGFDGFLANASLGLIYYFGRNGRHADWFYDDINQRLDDIEAQLREVIDNDKFSTQNTEHNFISNVKEPDNLELLELHIDSLIAETKHSFEEAEEQELNNDALSKHLLFDNSENDIFFTVQVGVYSREVPPEVFGYIYPLYNLKLEDGTIRYFSGKFSTEDEAKLKLLEARALGISDAFITAYYRGSRISLIEARKFVNY